MHSESLLCPAGYVRARAHSYDDLFVCVHVCVCLFVCWVRASSLISVRMSLQSNSSPFTRHPRRRAAIPRTIKTLCARFLHLFVGLRYQQGAQGDSVLVSQILHDLSAVINASETHHASVRAVFAKCSQGAFSKVLKRLLYKQTDASDIVSLPVQWRPKKKRASCTPTPTSRRAPRQSQQNLQPASCKESARQSAPRAFPKAIDLQQLYMPDLCLEAHEEKDVCYSPHLWGPRRSPRRASRLWPMAW
jgi:hypothetical protein